MSNYNIKHIVDIDKVQLKKGTFLWAFHVDKIPPHVGISIDGFYFSMKASECDFNLDVETVYQVVHRKKIPSFLVSILHTQNLDQLKMIFKQYGNKIKKGESCMTPVIQFLEENEQFLLEELLESLTQSNRIESVMGLHLPKEFEQVPFYTHEDVQSHIAQLKNVKR
jgi:hypothetical protein